MFFLKAKPESDWHGMRGVSEVTVRPEIFFEGERDFQDVQQEFNSIEAKQPKSRLNIFRKRKTPKVSESNPELKSNALEETKNEANKKQSKTKKRFSFMRGKTKSNLEDVVKPSASLDFPPKQDDVDEFKYSDVSTFVKFPDCDVPRNSICKNDFGTLTRVLETEESPAHSSPLRNYEGTSISESFSWKEDIWKDPWSEPAQSPSITSWVDDRSESRASSTLEKRRKAFFPFRSSDSATITSEKGNTGRKYGKKGIDLETTKQLNQMISLVASEESDDPWEDSWNRWQSSETSTADSLSEGERMTPDSGWADFSIFDRAQGTASSTAVDVRKNISERLMNTSFDGVTKSQQIVPPIHENEDLVNCGRVPRRQRPRSWFRSSSKHHNNVFKEAQTLLDILHETYPEQELGSPDTDLRTV